MEHLKKCHFFTGICFDIGMRLLVSLPVQPVAFQAVKCTIEIRPNRNPHAYVCVIIKTHHNNRIQLKKMSQIFFSQIFL